MDKETVKYIITYFFNLLSDKEKFAWKHQSSILKLEDNNNPNLLEMYKRKGWITNDKEVLDLLIFGNDQFELNTAKRVLEKYPDKIFLNKCPKCNKLARTPNAKQCRFCDYNWHNE